MKNADSEHIHVDAEITVVSTNNESAYECTSNYVLLFVTTISASALLALTTTYGLLACCAHVCLDIHTAHDVMVSSTLDESGTRLY